MGNAKKRRVPFPCRPRKSYKKGWVIRRNTSRSTVDPAQPSNTVRDSVNVMEWTPCQLQELSTLEASQTPEGEKMEVSEISGVVVAAAILEMNVEGSELAVSPCVDGADPAVGASGDDADLAVNTNVDSAGLIVSTNTKVADSAEVKIEGRRIVDIGFVWSEIHRTFDEHAKETRCRFRDWKLLRSHRRGLLTQLFFQCSMCNHRDNIWTECIGATNMDVNSGAIIGSLTTGIGFSQLEELCAAVNIPCMSEKTYIKSRESLVVQLLSAAEMEMKAAGEAEKKLAINRGDVHNGIPYISVVVDGSWIKRSYGTNYDSLSGVGAIIGNHTGKVLFVGIRNKFCTVCDIAQRGGTEPKIHTCYKNFDRNASSTSMESDAIVQGFKCSFETHQLIYRTVVADGDSNVYKSIRDNDPYRDQGVQVKKIECVNHLLRNLCKKIRAISGITQTKGERKKGFVKARDAVKRKILTIRKEVMRAASRWRQDKQPYHCRVKELQKELLNISSHVFGEHKRCGDRKCHEGGGHGELNVVPALKAHGLYQKVCCALEYISCFSDSLLFNLTNNVAESFNSIICKDIGGKRINFALRDSYTGRVAAAVLQYNTQEVLTTFHDSVHKTVPYVAQNLEKRRQRRISRRKNARAVNGRKRGFRGPQGLDKHYGPNSEKPDVEPEVYKQLCENHFQKLSENAENWKQIEKDTRDQSLSELWLALRKSMLTASNFGVVCRMRPTTLCGSKVKNLLYPPISDALSLKYGNDYEDTARRELAIEVKKEIRLCGLFIDQEFPFLGASPDGLIDEDGLVEIKCPITVKDFAAPEAAKALTYMKGVFDKSNPDTMNRKHQYFYQVQGQLHVSRRNYCIFAVWTPVYMKWIRIDADPVFWDHHMEPLLHRFYHECMLPEIVDSRFNRHMPIRNPEYITKAVAETELKKVVKTDHKRKPQSFVDRPSKVCKTRILGKAIVQEDDDCIVASHEKGKGFAPEDAKSFREMLDNKTHSLTAIKSNVLPVDSRLDDDSLDEFMRIVRSKYAFETQSVEYMYCHPTLVQPVQSKRSVQLVGGNSTDHWRCLYFNGAKLRVYDSLPGCNYDRLADKEKEYIRLRYPTIREIDITFQPVQTQPVGVSCGIYASAFATTVVLGRDPCKSRYSNDEALMRRHFVSIIENESLLFFPGP